MIPVAINIRGTSGAGKSTLVKKITALYPSGTAQRMDGRKRPIGVWYGGPDEVPRLFVPGHYETACGGCDTIKTVDQVYDLVRGATERGYNVLYEGIMVMDDVRRAVELHKVSQLTVIGLTTPVDVCIARIIARRAERGEDRPLKEKNTRDRAERCTRGLARLRDAGVRVERLDCDEALVLCRQLLGVQ